MKKLKYLLISLLLLPLFVKADGGGPMDLSIDVIVTNPNGTILYDYDWDEDDEEYLIATDKTLDFQKKLSIKYTETFNDKEYGAYEICEEYYDEDYDDWDEECTEYYIDMNDLSVQKEEFTLKDLKNKILNDDNYSASDIETDVSKIYIYDNNTKLYKGPSELYSLYDYQLNIGDIFTVEAEVSGWYYVTKGSQNGWLPNDYTADDRGRNIWILDDTDTFTNPSVDARNSSYKIPAGTKFDQVFELYLESDSEDFDYYNYYIVKYNGEYVIIDDEYVAISSDGFETNYELNSKKGITLYNIDAYKNYNDLKSNIEISASTEIEPLYVFSSRYYVRYGNKYAWINDDESIAVEHYYQEKFLTINKLDLHNNYDSKKTTSVPAGVELDVLYYFYDYEEDEDLNWYVVKYNNNFYWVNSNQEYAEQAFYDEEDEEDSYIILDNKKYAYTYVTDIETEEYFDKGENVKVLYYYYQDVTDSQEQYDNADCNSYYDVDEDGYHTECTVKWYFVDNGTKTGWIKAEGGEMDDLAQKIEEAKSEHEEETEPEVILIEDKSLSQEELIYICAFGALAISAVCFVTIKLVNKKKKDKEVALEDVKTEDKKEEKTEEVKKDENKSEEKVEETKLEEKVEEKEEEPEKVEEKKEETTKEIVEEEKVEETTEEEKVEETTEEVDPEKKELFGDLTEEDK